MPTKRDNPTARDWIPTASPTCLISSKMMTRMEAKAGSLGWLVVSLLSQVGTGLFTAIVCSGVGGMSSGSKRGYQCNRDGQDSLNEQ